MRDILTRAQIELREIRQINFLCDACNCLTAQDIDRLPLPSNPDIEPAEKWHYAIHCSLIEARCDDQTCESRIKILVPTGRGMEPDPSEQLPRYYERWATNDKISCKNGHMLAIPPSSKDTKSKVIYQEK
jgi:hypothetical protein